MRFNGTTIPTHRDETYDTSEVSRYPASSSGDIEVEVLNVTENGIYTAPDGKAYSPVNVNVEGGGSSDFSTAEVTATYTLPEGVTSLEGISFATSFINVLNADYNVIIQFSYGEEYLPLSDLGTVENINVPIYKDYPASISSLIYEIPTPELALFGVDLANSSVVSGDAVIDMERYCLLVSGDCSLNIALGFLD